MRYLYLAVISILLSTNLFAQHASDTITLDQVDGPYIFHTDRGIEVVRVSDLGVEVSQYENRVKAEPFWVHSQDGRHQFEVTLRDEITRPAWQYAMPDSLFVMSDPHGDLNAFVALLQAHEVIDYNYSWNYGNKHLVIIGDVFDRGDDVLPIFWLIYKIETEAKEAGGAVHFLLGNHEEMVLRNDVRYTNKKYSNLALMLDKPQNKMWTEDSELGKWLLTRNTMEKIGNNLIVHAGLSKEFLDQKWDIGKLNEAISPYLPLSRDERRKTEEGTFLFGNKGPLWYRGMVKMDEKYFPIDPKDVDKILTYYKAERVFVGHTIFDDVSSFFDTKVIAVNVKNKKNMDEGRSRAAIVTKDGIFRLYDASKKVEKIEE